LEIDGHELALAGVPKAERVNVWLERRPARIESLPDGRRWARDRLSSHQCAAIADDGESACLRSARRGRRCDAQIAAWPISVNAPRRPTARASCGPTALRRRSPLHKRRQIAIWSSAFLLVLAAWLGWLAWRNWRAAAAQPFARALHEMRHLGGTAPEAWRAYASAPSIRPQAVSCRRRRFPCCSKRVPQLQPLRPEIEQFFAQSTALFFGGGLPADRCRRAALCAQLRRIEKRIER
jgi:mxaA protein